MGVIFILIFISLSVAGLFLFLFILNVKNNQYEDTHTPSIRILFDDELLIK
ncbi:MAG: cbb3-type cytochrome oxidase assembly protein CcoS [Bacteroidetes bacterium]|nr:MAG: cbb3-type cytochrome oxidase assembly protein CcoS [Bacteroidota bacterium]